MTKLFSHIEKWTNWMVFLAVFGGSLVVCLATFALGSAMERILQ